MYHRNDRLLIREDVRNYVGQWVAVYNHEIIAHSRDITEVKEEVKRNCPNMKVSFTRITSGGFVFDKMNRLELNVLSCF